MAQAVDAVIAGAGINGASIAFNLAKRGCRSVIVLERHTVASGGTGKSSAMIRQHYSSEVLAKIAKRCRHIFEHFRELVGGDSGFVKTGYLFLVPEVAAERFRANMAMLDRLGVDTRCVSETEAKAICPGMDFGDAAGIAFEPGSGYADPYESTMSYLAAAKELGVKVRQSSPVRDIRINRGEIEAVLTRTEEFATRIVINATGPWANVVGKMVDICYPIRVTREQEVVLRPGATAAAPALTVSDMCNAIYFHPFGRDLIIGRGFPKEYENADPDNYAEGFDQDFLEDVSERWTRRAPAMTDFACVGGHSGLYDVTPDWHPIIGRHRVLPGLIHCVGFSGHGFKLAPVVGEAVAELVLEGKAREVDLDPFSLDRFDEGREFKGAYGGNRA